MRWIARFEIAIGVWVLVSPWIVGYSSFAPALWSAVISGAIIALLGLWRMFGDKLDEKL